MSEHGIAPNPTTDETRPPSACSACPHVWAEHDALGVRYCTATMASTHSRGCICGPARLAV